jgi:hypothetical protein
MTFKSIILTLIMLFLVNKAIASKLTTNINENRQAVYVDGRIVFGGDSVSETPTYVDFRLGHDLYNGVLIDGNRGTGTLQRILLLLNEKSGNLMAISYSFDIDDVLIKLRQKTESVQCGAKGAGIKKIFFIEKKYTTPKCRQKTEVFICAEELKKSVCASSSSMLDVNSCIQTEGKFVEKLMRHAEIAFKDCVLD